jgi:glycine cleavage system H protein
MNIPADLRYTATHEWVRVAGDIIHVGITDYAQGALGDIVFVERPSVGQSYDQGEEAATIESVKAASPIYCPVSGTVTETNAELERTPELVNEDPYGAFIFALRLSEPAQLDGLLDAARYREVVEKEESGH